MDHSTYTRGSQMPETPQTLQMMPTSQITNTAYIANVANTKSKRFYVLKLLLHATLVIVHGRIRTMQTNVLARATSKRVMTIPICSYREAVRREPWAQLGFSFLYEVAWKCRKHRKHRKNRSRHRKNRKRRKHRRHYKDRRHRRHRRHQGHDALTI